VITPFLPGDSLLFATGAIASLEGSGLNVYIMAYSTDSCGIIGDFVNYAIGKRVGPRNFYPSGGWFFKSNTSSRRSIFYENLDLHDHSRTLHTIVRTFAPFVAGIAKMKYGVS